MRNVVEKVLGAERQAREAIDSAKAEAVRLRAEADRQAEVQLASARAEAARLLRERLDAARAAASATLAEGQQAAEKLVAHWYATREPELTGLAQRVLKQVVATDLEKR